MLAGLWCLLRAQHLDRSGLAGLHLAVSLDGMYVFLNLSRYYLWPAMRWELAVLY